MNLQSHQQVFMLFFAIFWGAVANVQPRWKAFQYPLMFTPGLWNVTWRVLLSILLLMLLPIIYFALILYGTRDIGPAPTDTDRLVIAKLLIQGVLPALGMFGIYRTWLAIVELQPSWFYKSELKFVPTQYWHVEPTYRLRYNHNQQRHFENAVIDLGEDGGKANLFAALIYLNVALVFRWLY